MRWGKSADYLGFTARQHQCRRTYVHPPKSSCHRWSYKDNQGQLLIQNIVGKARTGGGYLQYQVPKATGGPELPKLTYAGGYGEATSCSQSRQASIPTISTRWCSTAPSGSPRRSGGIADRGIGRIRSRSRPGSSLGAICGVMDGLAKGD